MKGLLSAFVVAIGLAVCSPGLSAQDTGTPAADTMSLDHVEELMQSGRTEDARAALLQWWSGPRADASTRDVQRGLWLRGRLTVDPAQAELDYRRLVVEYPGGAYSAQALFRLAQAAWEQGDSAEAAQGVARLAREYPGSRFRADAETWVASAGSPPPPPPAADTAVADSSGVAAPGVDSAAAPPSGDTSAAPARAEAPPKAETPPARASTTASTGRYAVQLGAFSSGGRAETLQRRAQDAGFEARIVRVPGSRLVRVRVGRFDSEGPASELLRRLRGRGFAAALVVDANREERISR